MLCIIELMASNFTRQHTTEHIIDVPDEVFMLHVAAFGKFTPSIMSDRELRMCKFLGTRDSAKYIGPAEEQETK
jgi:hypothetical protein